MIINDETDILEQNQEDDEDLKRIMTIYGYTEHKTSFTKTTEYKKLIDTFIDSNIERKYNFNLSPMTTNDIRKYANQVIIDETEEIDRKVGYIPGDYRLIYDYIAQTGDKNLQNGYRFANYMKQNQKLIEVTDIPITWKIDKERGGVFCILEYDIDNPDFLEKCPIVTSGIIMTNENDILGSVHLAHELTHALTDRNKGIVTNYYHSEVLTIYMELVTAYNINQKSLLDIAIEDRLSAIKQNILEELINKHTGYNEGEGMNYIASALYAFPLFERYKKDKNIRKEINQTLSGERTLEDTLSILDITEEEGSHVIRKEIKRRII